MGNNGSQGAAHKICSTQGAWLFYLIFRWIFQWPGSIRNRTTHVKLNKTLPGMAEGRMQRFLLWGELGKPALESSAPGEEQPPFPAQEHPSHLLQRDGDEVPEPDPWKRGRKAGKRRGKAARLMWLSRRGRFSVSSLKFLCIRGYFGSQKLLDSLEARGGRLPGFALTRFPRTAVCAISSGAALSKEDILSIKKKSIDDEYGFGLRLSDEILSEVQRSHYPSVCSLPGTSGGSLRDPSAFWKPRGQ